MGRQKIRTKPNTPHSFRRIFPKNTFISIFFFSLILLNIFFNTHQFFKTSSLLNAAEKEKIETIAVPSLSIYLPLAQAKIADGKWLLTDEKTAFYGEKSSYPGEIGTTVIFAHAKKGLFAALPHLKKNSIIIVSTDKKASFYKVTHNKIIDPKDTSFLNETTDKNRLAVFTCYGRESEKRIVFFASLVENMPLSKINLYKI